jgi:hypothetical protein
LISTLGGGAVPPGRLGGSRLDAHGRPSQRHRRWHAVAATLVQPGGRSMDAAASEVAAALCQAGGLRAAYFYQTTTRSARSATSARSRRRGCTTSSRCSSPRTRPSAWASTSRTCGCGAPRRGQRPAWADVRLTGGGGVKAAAVRRRCGGVARRGGAAVSGAAPALAAAAAKDSCSGGPHPSPLQPAQLSLRRQGAACGAPRDFKAPLNTRVRASESLLHAPQQPRLPSRTYAPPPPSPTSPSHACCPYFPTD